MNQNFRSGVKRFSGFDLLGNCLSGGKWFCGSFTSIPEKGSDRQAQLVEQVNKFFIHGKTHMAGAATGNGLGDPVFRQGRLIRIHFINHDLIEPEVRDKGILSTR